MSTEPAYERPDSSLEWDPTKIMNNFPLLFPASEEVVGQLGDYRRSVKSLNKEDSLIGEDLKTEKERALHSDKWLGQTYRQFYTEIDQAVIECGLTNEVIREMRNKVVQEKDPIVRIKMRKALHETLKPVFEKLLGRGYVNYDLSI